MKSNLWIGLLALVLAVGVVVVWAEARPGVPQQEESWVIQKIPGEGLVYIELAHDTKFMKKSELLNDVSEIAFLENWVRIRSESLGQVILPARNVMALKVEIKK